MDLHLSTATTEETTLIVYALVGAILMLIILTAVSSLDTSNKRR
jgi:uncharacterized membrane protein YeaQ/YmgE (transglycosylase-associated protein family)